MMMKINDKELITKNETRILNSPFCKSENIKLYYKFYGLTLINCENNKIVGSFFKNKK